MFWLYKKLPPALAIGVQLSYFRFKRGSGLKSYRVQNSSFLEMKKKCRNTPLLSEALSPRNLLDCYATTSSIFCWCSSASPIQKRGKQREGKSR
jgi:hypothetical protein